MRYVRAMVMLIAFGCWVGTWHFGPDVAADVPSKVQRVKALRMPAAPPTLTLRAITGFVRATPTECVAAEVRSGRAWLQANYGDTARWEFANINYGGLAYAWHNLIVIDSDMNGTCGYSMAVVFHEWTHLRTAEYFGSLDKAMVTVGCGEPMPEFPNTCRNIELIADCGGWYLSQLADVKEHHPYIDVYGCSSEYMALAQRVINGY